MPGSSSSRAISSAGSYNFISFYTVALRDRNQEDVVKYTNVAPGSTLTIDELREGSYTIAIRAHLSYETTVAAGSSTVSCYGAEDVYVKGGAENTVALTLKKANEFYNCTFELPSPDLVISGLKISCKNGDFYSMTESDVSALEPSGSSYLCYDFFFEPGFTYDGEFTIMTEIGDVTRKASAKAGKNGIVFTISE